MGFCGLECSEHECKQNFTIRVGEGEDGYKTIVKAFEENRIGTNARCIMLNPIYPGIPKIAIFNMSTCNCFDNNMVRQQYNYNKRMYEKHIESVLGPAIGISSDGDSRRRKLFMDLSTSTSDSRFYPIPKNHGFVFTGKVEGDKVTDLCDQDYIHNHKKLVNHLDHRARSLQIGNYLIHLNHIREVYRI